MANIKIWHGVYGEKGAETRAKNPKTKERISFLIPSKFDNLLKGRLEKHGYMVEFTYGVTVDGKIHALSIVHRPDSFSRKIGRKIVVGRIERLTGYKKTTMVGKTQVILDIPPKPYVDKDGNPAVPSYIFLRN